MRALRLVRCAALVVLLMLLPGCQVFAEPSPKTVDATVGSAFTLAPGGTAHLDDDRLTVFFGEVTDDSRCPEDVDCAWAGEATVVLVTTVQGRESEHEVHTDPQSATEATVDGYRVQLVGLSPGGSTDEIPADSYRADLLVERV